MINVRDSLVALHQVILQLLQHEKYTSTCWRPCPWVCPQVQTPLRCHQKRLQSSPTLTSLWRSSLMVTMPSSCAISRLCQIQQSLGGWKISQAHTNGHHCEPMHNLSHSGTTQMVYFYGRMGSCNQSDTKMQFHTQGKPMEKNHVT